MQIETTIGIQVQLSIREPLNLKNLFETYISKKGTARNM